MTLSQQRVWRANGLLLLAAVIWGFAFVAQRVGMEYVGPFTFNSARFALGGLALLPLLATQRRQRAEPLPWRVLAPGGVLAGVALFAGASCQQLGIVTTTAGKAGFITGLYVVLVPILGLARGQRTGLGAWLGAGLAVIGLYLLTLPAGSAAFRLTAMTPGDLWVLLGACFWAIHVHLLAWLSRRVDPLPIAVLQFMVTALLSGIAAALFETPTLAGLREAQWAILYGGLLSVGIGYTLQVVAQRDAHPTDAAIILSLEAVFAVIGGVALLDETFTARGLAGCALMLAGMLVSQLVTPAARAPQS
ncbi:MAG: putative DMT superfamily transporter inner membrane protein [Chloroflexi bacterium ADurb.Bin222]|nr:MAG: putative DMT superfamily transporter inner membrane protein [Chloroflexi bacterium ADurb.Bin222]